MFYVKSSCNSLTKRTFSAGAAITACIPPAAAPEMAAMTVGWAFKFGSRAFDVMVYVSQRLEFVSFTHLK